MVSSEPYFHRLFGPLGEANDRLTQSIDSEETTEEQRQELARARLAINRIADLLGGVDPATMPISWVDEIDDALIELKRRLDQFESEPVEARSLDNLWVHVDPLQQKAALIAATAAELQSPRNIEEILENTRAHSSRLTDELQQRVDTLSSKLEEESERLREFIEALDSRVHEQTGTIDTLTARVDSVVSDFQKQFSDTEAERRSAFTQSEKERDETATAAVEKLETLRSEKERDLNTFLTELQTSSTKAADSLLEEMRELRLQAGALAEATAVVAVGKEYRNQADAENEAADFWRSVSVACMGAAIITAIVLFVFFVPEAQAGGLDWSRVVRAVVLAALWAAPATYAQIESSRHRDAERRNRRVALQIDAMEPYLANLRARRRCSSGRSTGKLSLPPQSRGPRAATQRRPLPRYSTC